MTINGQIRDEKLQYDINREAAKISALSSVKIHKYEYLTGEDMLPSNQQQIIEPAKFTYSPLGKAFEKQKQIKAIQDQGQVKKIKFDYDVEDTPFTSKQKEIFNELVDERPEKITDLDKKVNSNYLIYRYKGNTADVKFNEFDNVLDVADQIRDGKIDLVNVKNNQEKLKYYLGEIKEGNKKHRSKLQKKTLSNTEML